MKKIMYACILMIISTACTKQELKNENTQHSDAEILADNGKTDKNINYNIDVNGKKSIKTDYIYKATDGTLVKVIFDYTPEKGSMSIRSNNKTFMLDKESSDGDETVYKKLDMKARVKGDSLILHQGNNTIELVKTKI